MSIEFKKPTRITIDPIPHLIKITGKGLIKDLQENQIICYTCEGTGLALEQSMYALRDEGDPNTEERFPYRKQYIVSCDKCVSGVISLCKHCQHPLQRYSKRCDCDGYNNEIRLKEAKEENERYEKALKIKSSDEKATSMGMYFSDYYSFNNGYFSDWEEFFEDYYEKDIDNEERPLYVWGTTCTSLGFDARSIVESATDDLHEDSMKNIDNSSIREMQDFLDKWAEEQSGTETYYVSYDYAIEIPWEDYND